MDYQNYFSHSIISNQIINLIFDMNIKYLISKMGDYLS